MFKTAANVDTIYIRPIIMLPKPKVGKHVHITKLYVFGFNYIRCLFVWFGHVYSFKKEIKNTSDAFLHRTKSNEKILKKKSHALCWRSIKENPHPVRVNISNIPYVHIKVKTLLNE